jgi:2-polyprenyl-3-methyl-5-hydroxy-6-metoxy-1,4-benzoquinol methylase
MESAKSFLKIGFSFAGYFMALGQDKKLDYLSKKAKASKVRGRVVIYPPLNNNEAGLEAVASISRSLEYLGYLVLVAKYPKSIPNPQPEKVSQSIYYIDAPYLLREKGDIVFCSDKIFSLLFKRSIYLKTNAGKDINKVTVDLSEANRVLVKDEHGSLDYEKQDFNQALFKAMSLIKFSQLVPIQQEIYRYLLRQDKKKAEYYLKRYSAEEAFYWEPVLPWIRELKGIKRVLDIGPGYGTLIGYTAKCQTLEAINAIDPVHYLPNALAKALRINFLNVDIEKTKIDGGPFDLVIFTEVIEHLNYHPSATLLKIKEAVSEKGFILITTPNSQEWGNQLKYYKKLDDIPVYKGQKDKWVDDHVWQYSKEELDTLFKKAGLKIVKFDYAPGVQGNHLCYLLSK